MFCRTCNKHVEPVSSCCKKELVRESLNADLQCKTCGSICEGLCPFCETLVHPL